MFHNAMIRSVVVLAILVNLSAAAPVAAPDTLEQRDPLRLPPLRFGSSGDSKPVTIPHPVSKPAAGKPSTDSSSSPAKSSSSIGDKLLPGLGAAGGLLGGLGSIGGLFNTIFHDPSTSPSTSCGFFHKLINDCPVNSTEPAPTAASATPVASTVAVPASASVTATATPTPSIAARDPLSIGELGDLLGGGSELSGLLSGLGSLLPSKGGDAGSSEGEHCGFFHELIHDCPSASSSAATVATASAVPTASTEATAVATPIALHIGIPAPVEEGAPETPVATAAAEARNAVVKRHFKA